MANTLEAVFRLTDQYTATMKKIIESSDSYEKRTKQAEKATEAFNSRMGKIKEHASGGSAGISSLTGKITKLVSAAYLGKKALDVMFGAIKTGAQAQVQETTFRALLDDAKAGTALYQYVGEYAKISALSKADLAAATTSFLSYTRDIEQIEKLNKLTERLYAKDPTQGASGAVFALKEVLSGDTMSIKDRFNMSGISGAKIRELTNAGDIEGTIDYLDQVFNKFGATQEVVDQNFNSLITQTNMFVSNLQAALGDEANPAVHNLSQAMQQLNEDMQAGKFQPFFDLVSKGLTFIGNGLAWVAENADILAPVIAGVAAAIVVYNGVMAIAAAITTVAGVAMNAAIGNWAGVAAAVAGIGGAIWMANSMMDNFGQSNEKAKSSLEDLKKEAGTGLANTDLDVNVTNEDPISVKGTVEIEKESLKYALDIAGARFFAKFSTATLAPQVNIYGQTIEKTTDLDEVTNYLGDKIAEMTEIQPQGAYA